MELGSPFITIYDFILTPIYLGVIFLIAKRTVEKNIENKRHYKYYISGLFVKITGGILFTLIYVYYYGEGDTTNYFKSSSAITRLFLYEPQIAFQIMLGDHSSEMFSYFNSNTGYPLWVMFLQKTDSFAIMRILVPFNLLGMNYFLPSVIILAYVAYKGIWKFYSFLCSLYPSFYKSLSIAILFIPSVIFWGSGYMKDTVTLTSSLWLFVNVHQIFVAKRKLMLNAFVAAINIVLIMYLKAYIIIAMIPTLVTYVMYSNIRVRHGFIRYFVSPLFLLAIFLTSYFLYNFFSEGLDQYGDMDSVLKKAVVTQQDLIRSEQYGQNFFDIGEFEPTLQGILGKAPIAIFSGLFRPMIWESQGFVPILSALESLLFIFFSIYAILKIGIGRFVRFFASESPLTVSFLIFAIFLAFAVGLTTANFGALVRYRIPLLPFYFSLLIIVYKKHQRFKTINYS